MRVGRNCRSSSPMEGQAIRRVFTFSRIGFSGLAMAIALIMGLAPTVASPANVSAAVPSSAPLGTGPYYLALGDSVPVWDGSSSYPNLLLAQYQKALPNLQLVNLAVSGETTTSMLQSGQFAAALAFLQAHQNEIALITIDIGGNDVVGCGFSSDPNCFSQAEATMEQNLTTILDGLRAAASGAPIFGMTYYDPFLGNWLAGGAAQTQALAQIPQVVTLNNELTALYGPANTADVQGAFEVTNSTTLESSPWGTAPVDVVDACQWLDIFCAAGQTEGFGDDPNIAGQVQIANAFEKVIGPGPIITNLQQAVAGVGPGNLLSTTVAVARFFLAYNDVRATCFTLKVFVLEVDFLTFFHSVPPEIADQLIASANQIENVLDC